MLELFPTVAKVFEALLRPDPDVLELKIWNGIRVYKGQKNV